MLTFLLGPIHMNLKTVTINDCLAEERTRGGIDTCDDTDALVAVLKSLLKLCEEAELNESAKAVQRVLTRLVYERKNAELVNLLKEPVPEICTGR